MTDPRIFQLKGLIILHILTMNRERRILIGNMRELFQVCDWESLCLWTNWGGVEWGGGLTWLFGVDPEWLQIVHYFFNILPMDRMAEGRPTLWREVYHGL